LLALWIAVVIYFWITEPRYLTGSNISNMLQQNSILFVVALAETVILLMGAVDLSIGGMVVLIGLVLLWINHGIPSVLVIILTVVAGAALSALVNGVPIGGWRMNPFVVTLGTAAVFRGLANVFTGGGNTKIINNPGFVSTLANGSVGPIPAAVIVMAVALLIFWALLRFTYFGRDVYAVGGNPEAAALSGISVARVRIAGFGLLGAAGGTAAVLQAGQLSSVAPTAAVGLELTAIAAVLLGGTSLAGGKGGVIGTSVAVLFLGSLSNGLDLGGISSFWQNVVTGFILFTAVGFDQLRGQLLARRTRRETT